MIDKDKLNENQKKAVEHVEGPCMVLAGPGSGKTRVITYRIANMIVNNNIPPARILAISFTKNSSMEMKNRALQICNDPRINKVTFGTFHAVFYKILRYFGSYNMNSILDEKTKRITIKGILKNLKVENGEDDETVGQVINEISYVKNELMDKQDFESDILTKDEFINTYNIEYDDFLQNVEKNRLKAEEDRLEAEKLKKEIEDIKAEYEGRLERVMAQREKIISKAKSEAFSITRQAKEQSENILKELRKLETEMASKQKQQKIEALRKELSDSMGNLQPSVKSMIVPKVSSKEIKDLKPGDDVKVVTLNQDGTVVSVDKKKKEALVQIGIMKMTLPFKSLQQIQKDKKSTVTKTTRKIISEKSGKVKGEVDLRGMNLEEAIMEVEKYLDDACVAGLETVTIIHGIGTGVLKKGLQDILKRNKHVKSKRPGEYGEGGAGVTIVTLR